MHDVFSHLSCISSISTSVFSRQFEASQASGHCYIWKHAEGERYSTGYLLYQMTCFQTDISDMDASAHLVLTYTDCFYTEPSCSQTASYTFNWTCSTGHVSRISRLTVTACVNEFLTVFFVLVFIYLSSQASFIQIYFHTDVGSFLIATPVCQALHQPKDMPHWCCLN